jgi:hypothetical protein
LKRNKTKLKEEKPIEQNFVTLNKVLLGFSLDSSTIEVVIFLQTNEAKTPRINITWIKLDNLWRKISETEDKTNIIVKNWIFEVVWRKWYSGIVWKMKFLRFERLEKEIESTQLIKINKREREREYCGN